VIQLDHLPPVALKKILVPDIQAHAEPMAPRGRHRLTRETVDAAIAHAGGNKVEAAKALGVSRATLYRFMDETDPAGP
jgi:sigma-54 dependent transcriptional regulator, acetoin dehydrogenase operon transcriptional activator AcoR